MGSLAGHSHHTPQQEGVLMGCVTFSQQSVCMWEWKGGPALVSSVKVRTSIIFYMECFCCSAEGHKRTISVFIAKLPLVHFSCPCWSEERQQSSAIANASLLGKWRMETSCFFILSRWSCNNYNKPNVLSSMSLFSLIQENKVMVFSPDLLGDILDYIITLDSI